MRVALLLVLTASCASGAGPRSASAPPPPRAPVKPACTRTVGPSEAAELGAIVAALPDQAVLCLQPGVYPAHLRLHRSLTVRGLGPGVVLDGEHRAPTVEVLDGAIELVLERLTLTGGSGGALGRGGNLHVHDARLVTLRQVLLDDGRSDHNGGGALLVRSGAVVAEDCQMRHSRGRRGQAVLVDGPATLTLRRCLVVGEGEEPVARVVGPGELHLERSTVVGPGVAVQASGTLVDAPVVTISGCILGATPIAVDAPGPAPSVRVSGSALARALEGAVDGGDNRVGDLALEADYRPRAGSPAMGRGVP